MAQNDRRCPKCNGSGRYRDHECPACKGAGYVDALLQAIKRTANLITLHADK